MTDIIEVLRGFDDHMERVEPGYKARKAAEHARREAEAAEGRARLIAEYGSEEAVFARNDREQALWDAVSPHGRVEMSVGADGTEDPPYIAECLGVEHTYYHSLLPWLWLQLTGYRDAYGRKAALMLPWA